MTPEIVIGLVMLVVMLFAIFIGVPISFTLLFLALTDQAGNLAWISPARRGAAREITAARHDRLDTLRAVAIVWMALFHFCFDLAYFKFTRQNFYADPFWTVQRTCILGLFLSNIPVKQLCLDLFGNTSIAWILSETQRGINPSFTLQKGACCRPVFFIRGIENDKCWFAQKHFISLKWPAQRDSNPRPTA